MTTDVLLVFVKNAVPGKVKTRLAATVGQEKAMLIYHQLLQHTNSIVQSLSCHKIIFYSDTVPEEITCITNQQTQIQHGVDLGEKMENAFDFAFENRYGKAVIIGSDCPEITTEIIMEAFRVLDNKDVVIGPAADGGYYLLGMKKKLHRLFRNMQWSTDKVLGKTIQHCEENNLAYSLLPVLHDVDEEADLPYLKAIL